MSIGFRSLYRRNVPNVTASFVEVCLSNGKVTRKAAPIIYARTVTDLITMVMSLFRRDTNIVSSQILFNPARAEECAIVEMFLDLMRKGIHEVCSL
jgi:hypothetical protein